MMTTSRPESRRLVQPVRARRRRRRRLGEDVDADLGAEHAQLLDGRRALEVGRDQVRLAALLLEPAASFAAAVVLPAPWRPASKMTVGGLEA